MKQSASASKLEKLQYEDIYMPKNTAIGIYIALGSFLFGFGLIWHIWWLSILGFMSIIICLIIRSLADETEYCIPAAEVKKLEESRT